MSILNNKDTAGAIGSIGGSSVIFAWSGDIYNLFFALFQHWGLADKALESATNISTDITVIMGGAIAAFFASWFIRHKPNGGATK